MCASSKDQQELREISLVDVYSYKYTLYKTASFLQEEIAVPSDLYYHFFILTRTLTFYLILSSKSLGMETLALILSLDYLHFVMLLQHRGGIESYSRWMFSIPRAERENQCRYGAVVLHSSDALVRSDCWDGLTTTSFICTVTKVERIPALRHVQPLLRQCRFALLIWFLHSQHT